MIHFQNQQMLMQNRGLQGLSIPSLSTPEMQVLQRTLQHHAQLQGLAMLQSPGVQGAQSQFFFQNQVTSHHIFFYYTLS